MMKKKGGGDDGEKCCVETAEGRIGLQREASTLSPRTARLQGNTVTTLCVCVCASQCVCVCVGGGMSLKLMTAMKWDEGGIDFFTTIDRQGSGAKNSLIC